MSLKNDTSTAAKMVACSELIRRLEHNSIGEVLPETKAALDSKPPTQQATAYIKIEDGGPAEFKVCDYDTATGRREPDDVHPQAFAFGITIENEPDLTAAAISAARDRLEGLLELHGGQL